MHALSRLSPIFLLFVLVFVVLTLREIYTSAQLAELREENARLRSALAPCMPTINKPPGKGKLKAIFVLGTEGVGHHMIMPAIARVSCVENSFSDLENAIFLVYETYIPIHNFKRMEVSKTRFSAIWIRNFYPLDGSTQYLKKYNSNLSVCSSAALPSSLCLPSGPDAPLPEPTLPERSAEQQDARGGPLHSSLFPLL
jgi:hypothetical protein